jgi:uncharacterized phosphosugar-binding protein
MSDLLPERPLAGRPLAPVLAFAEAAAATLAAAFEREAAHLELGARWLAEAVAQDGLVRVFGTGHSRLLAEEVFYRAGGLAPVDAVLEDSVSGYHDVAKSEFVERLEGFGELIVAHRRMAPPDILIVISQSGRNAVPIEVAQAARRRGVRTIGLTSLRHAAGQPSRHSSGLHLHDVVDLVIDNGCPDGDCAVRLGDGSLVGPLSTVVGSALIQALVVGAAEELRVGGIRPPVFRSGNVDGGREASEALLDRYWSRVRGW